MAKRTAEAGAAPAARGAETPRRTHGRRLPRPRALLVHLAHDPVTALYAAAFVAAVLVGWIIAYSV